MAKETAKGAAAPQDPKAAPVAAVAAPKTADTNLEETIDFESQLQQQIEATLVPDNPQEDPETPAEPEEPANQEPAEETGEAPETDPEADPDDNALTPEAQASVDKRIGKEVAKRKEAEEELAALKTRLAALEERAPEAQAAPVAPIAQQIESRIAQLESRIDWAAANPDGGEVVDANGKTVTLSPEDVRKMSRQAEREIRSREGQLLDFQRQVAQQTQEFTHQAYEAYPALKDKTSELYQAVQQAKTAFPAITQLPGHLLAISDQIEGRKLREARAAAAKKPVAKPPAKVIPPRSPKPSAAPPAPAGKQALTSAAKNRFMETGNPNDAKEMFVNMLGG